MLGIETDSYFSTLLAGLLNLTVDAMCYFRLSVKSPLGYSEKTVNVLAIEMVISEGFIGCFEELVGLEWRVCLRVIGRDWD